MKRGENLIKRFASPEAFLEWATYEPSPWKRELKSRQIAYNPKDFDFFGTKTYDEAYRLARFGWPEGLKLLAKNIETADSYIHEDASSSSAYGRGKRNRSRANRYDVAGLFPSAARAAASEILNMRVPAPQNREPQPSVSIALNNTASASIPSDMIMAFGGALCSYIDKLEQLDISVNLSWMEISRQYDRTVGFVFPLKDREHDLSLSSAVFWLAHPSALRRIAFSATERLDIEKWFGDGYGYPFFWERDSSTKALILNPGKDLADQLEYDAPKIDPSLLALRIIHYQHEACARTAPYRERLNTITLG